MSTLERPRLIAVTLGLRAAFAATLAQVKPSVA